MERSTEHDGGADGGLGDASKASFDNKRNKMRSWPLIWLMLRPRLLILLLGLALTAIKVRASLVIPVITRRLIDTVLSIRSPHPELLRGIIATVFGAMAIQAVASYALNQLLSIEGQRLITELRVRVQRHVGLLPLSYYDHNSTGTLVARIMNDVEGVRNFVGTGLVDFATSVLTAAWILDYMLRCSIPITLTVSGIVILFAILLKYFFVLIRPIFREQGRINAEVLGRLTESLGGVRVIKGYHAEEREAGIFAKGAGALLNNTVKSLTLTGILTTLSAVVITLVSVIVIFMGGHLVMYQRWTIGEFVQYSTFVTFLTAPVFQIVNLGAQLTEAMAGLDRTNELLAEMEESASPHRNVCMPLISGDVHFDDVEFAYEKDKPVLHGITFHAAPGTVTALVGPSGSGKSTIISLICAFYTPSAGSARIDGIDLSLVNLGSFRTQLGVVLQDSFLFDGSIRDNILFSSPHVTEEEFLFASHTARVNEFAEQFPDRYETIVGERGVRLSMGQRQRLSIARALLAQPRILILDEATSSLDSESEAMIQEGLSKLMQGRTTFVIAHRLSTIRRADQILVVENGHIIERGSHQELYARGGRYYDLYTRQYGIETDLFLAPGEGDRLPGDRLVADALTVGMDQPAMGRGEVGVDRAHRA